MERNLIKNWDDIKNETESDWLDFKQRWHENKAELIRDILNFCNSLTNKQYRYIIYGVEENNITLEKNIIDIKDDPNRKTEENLQNFLAGNNLSAMPEIKVYQINCQGETIDVLRIESDTSELPYVIEKKYVDGGRKLIKNGIYIRNGKTNTPICDCAFEYQIEKLYRKKFMLDTTPKSKILKYLNDVNSWEKSEDSEKEIFYYSNDINCQIEVIDKNCDKYFLQNCDIDKFVSETYIDSSILVKKRKNNNINENEYFTTKEVIIRYNYCIIFKINVIFISIKLTNSKQLNFYFPKLTTIENKLLDGMPNEIKFLIKKNFMYKICKILSKNIGISFNRILNKLDYKYLSTHNKKGYLKFLKNL